MLRHGLTGTSQDTHFKVVDLHFALHGLFVSVIKQTQIGCHVTMKKKIRGSC